MQQRKASPKAERTDERVLLFSADLLLRVARYNKTRENKYAAQASKLDAPGGRMLPRFGYSRFGWEFTDTFCFAL